MLSERLKKLTPYVPGEQPQDKKYIKLNTNENPYPPSPRIKSFLSSFEYQKLRLYPDPQALELRKKISTCYNLPVSSVFVGNGSDEVLSFAFFAFFDSLQGDLLFPEFTYSFYPVYCDFYSISYKKIRLNKEFSINIDNFLSQTPSCGIIFPNPNAPTGTYLEADRIQELLHEYQKDRVIIIDEAYIDFGGETAASLLSQHENLLITKTFSKSRSLAGIRLGYALGQEHLIKALFTTKDSFNSYPIDTLAQNICSLAMEDAGYYRNINAKIIGSRDFLSRSLTSLGWVVLPSKANFLFARFPGIPGKELYLTLKDNGILVRYFDIKGIKEFVRITIGTEEEIKLFLIKVKELFSS
ncbi:MAG: histidinol-phosphate transaminase [Spirochaetales bacterium]|nr:histidinol-phosphate transaminase [Spirochaetales bacterium]